MTRIVAIGECMVELREQRDGTLERSFGGDTLNTAVYLARQGVSVDYLTALGDDPWSDEMLAAWQAEGVGVAHVQRLAGKLPGLYIVQTCSNGERRFMHWREASAARQAMVAADLNGLLNYDVAYFSGITLSIYDDLSRDRLFTYLDKLKLAGGKVVFDTNFRPRNWADREKAQLQYEWAFGCADIVLGSTEDLQQLYGECEPERLMKYAPGREIVLKSTDNTSRILLKGKEYRASAAPVVQVVDTTAAGDSYAAAYIAARFSGADPVNAAQAGHDLAGVVVGFPGAIIPRDALACWWAMPHQPALSSEMVK